MRIRTFECEQTLPAPRDRVFAFFSDAWNLERITPPSLRFEVLTPGPIEIGEGTILDYRLKLRGIPFRWRTLIREWNPPHAFVDEQVKGPYRQWIHRHEFEDAPGGTLCRDRVDYAAFGGGLVDRLFVRPEIERIFAFRRETLASVFRG